MAKKEPTIKKTLVNMTKIADLRKSKVSQVNHELSFVKGAVTAETSTLAKNLENKDSLDDRYYNIITPQRLKQLRTKANAAIEAGKTFLMRAQFPILRRTFWNRGWIELYETHYTSHPSGVTTLSYYDLVRSIPTRHYNELLPSYILRCERYILSRLIQHTPVHFIWSLMPNKDDFDHQVRYPNTIVSKLIVSPFVNKEELACNLRGNLLWLSKKEAAVNSPRTYCSRDRDELTEFYHNFYYTACIGFLKYILEKSEKSSWELVFVQHPAADVPYSAVEFALERGYELLAFLSNNDIDRGKQADITDGDWNAFLQYHRLLTQKQAKIRRDKDKSVESALRKATLIVDNIKHYRPEYDADGYLNVRIVKPTDRTSGSRLNITNNLNKIKDIINEKQGTPKKYIIQKYIENPFTIYKTKFAIHQHFLVTNVYPLTIWFYTENYIRFSSKLYSLDDFHESIHSTDSVIPSKYNVNAERSIYVPDGNMWDCYAFQTYLLQSSLGDMWSNKIYPGLKKAIVGAVLASQPNMIQRSNTFQLYSAEFILCQDLKPWLIDINSSPNLHLKSNVRNHINPQCVEDILKVVVDRKNNPKANTGKFELIYDQEISSKPSKSSVTKRSLNVTGKRVPIASYQPRRDVYRKVVEQSRSPFDPKKSYPLAITAKPIGQHTKVVEYGIRNELDDKRFADSQIESGDIRNEFSQR